MRLFLLFALSLFLSPVLSGQTLYFSESEAVAEAVFGNKAPRIAILGDGTPVAYLGKSGSVPELWVVRREADGWAEPVAVPIGDLDVNLWGNALGPQMATHGNTIFVVFEAYGQGIFVSRSTDGGLSFGAPQSVVDLPPGRFATLPTIATDLSGNPQVGFITTNASEQDARYEFTRSPDGGDFYLDPIVVNGGIAGEEVCECCPSSITIDADGVIYVSYRNNDNNIRDMWVMRSTDGGITFVDPTDVDSTDWEVFICPGSGPHSISAGEELVTGFFSAGEGTSSVYVSSLERTDMSVQGQWKMMGYAGGSGNQNYPRLAGSGDTLAMVWEESVTGNSKEVVLSYSTTGPAGLANETVLLAGGQFSQGNPDIVYRNGIFHIVYWNQIGNFIAYRQGSFEPLATGVSELIAREIWVFPNPASDELIIELESGQGEPVSVWLDDTSGRTQVFRNEVGPHIRLPIAHLPAGIYFLQVRMETGTTVRRVMVE